MPEKILNMIFILLFAILGIVAGAQPAQLMTAYIPKTLLTETVWGISALSLGMMILSGMVGAVAGVLVAPYLNRFIFLLTAYIEKSLSEISIQNLLLGTVGLFIGLIIANLVGAAFENIPYIGPYISIVLSILLGYVGMHMSIIKQGEISDWIRLRPGNTDKAIADNDVTKGKLLDTSVIIDGRVADIRETGFLEGKIIVPVFVLGELQKIADSSDLLKRNRGRRGLDILNKMRKIRKDNFTIVADDFEDITEVDSKLIRLARKRGYQIITNDYNLNKVAELQEVQVLNINDLAGALKPVVIPGEKLFVQLIKHGKENGQGVAYLDDGTMIVVENGGDSIGKDVAVVIASVLQTSAGRMIFAEMESSEQ